MIIIALLLINKHRVIPKGSLPFHTECYASPFCYELITVVKPLYNLYKLSYERHQMGEPELKNKIELDEVELVLPLGKVANVVKDVVNNDRKELTERQKVIVNLIKVNDRITIDEMTEKVKVSEKTIRRELSVLYEKGILIREGGRKDGRWTIV